MTAARRPLQNLRDCCLLSMESSSNGGERFSMHPVVWDFAERARRQQPTSDQLPGLETFLDWMLQRGTRLAQLEPGKCDPAGIAEAHQLLADELPSFEALAAHLAQSPLFGSASVGQANVCQGLHKLAVAVANYGNARIAAALLRQAVAVAVDLLGSDHPDTLISRNDLASQLGELGQHAEAAVMHREVLAIQLYMLGAEHPDTLRSRNSMTFQLGKLGRHAEAAAMHHEVLAVMQRVLGAEHPDTLRSRMDLARQMGNLGRCSMLRRPPCIVRCWQPGSVSRGQSTQPL